MLAYRESYSSKLCSQCSSCFLYIFSKNVCESAEEVRQGSLEVSLGWREKGFQDFLCEVA